jgi:ADP-ribosylglycohydrolase
MSHWSNPLSLLREELQQRRDEGARIPSNLLARIDALHHIADAWNEPAVWALYDEVLAVPGDEELAAAEPNELAAIRALRPAGPRDLNWRPSADDLRDRLHGAWTGRATGCALGKPVEGMGMGVRDGKLCGRSDIKKYLQNRGEWPLVDFFSTRDVGDGMRVWCEASTREKIAYMEPDDDIHYSLTGLGVIEQHGPEFTWNQVADFWLSRIPINAICTAESQAILSYMTRTQRASWTAAPKTAATPAFTRRNRNPYREWIGAQIRSDGWAWCAAGKPELAAEFAFRDACWTHERNGIYGEMLFAAIQAAAFVEHDPRKLVEIGLSEIPRDCRLARIVRRTLDICSATSDWEVAMEQIETICNTHSQGIMSAVHTINNAAICVLALIHGKMDTFDAINLSVMAALDTDCNGATVGSIVGAAAGKKRFSPRLATRLNDTIKPNLIGFQEVTMADLAQRTAVQWERCDAYWAKRQGRAVPAATAAAAGVA